MTTTPNIPFETAAISELCERWKIAELALFGSALREDFGPESDVDFLVTFQPDASWSLLDHAAMEEELGQILGRRVDLVTRRAVERSRNWLRRRVILESAQFYYEDIPKLVSVVEPLAPALSPPRPGEP